MAKSRVIDRDRGWAKISASVRGLGRGVKVKIGVLDSAGTYPDGTSVAAVAATHEYGGGHVPARPFIRPAIDEGEHVFALEAERLAKFVIAGGKLTQRDIGERMGEVGRRLILHKILNGPFTPLAPSTIRRKGHARPLLETLRLYDSISYEIEGSAGAGSKPAEPSPGLRISNARASAKPDSIAKLFARSQKGGGAKAGKHEARKARAKIARVSGGVRAGSKAPRPPKGRWHHDAFPAKAGSTHSSGSRAGAGRIISTIGRAITSSTKL